MRLLPLLTAGLLLLGMLCPTLRAEERESPADLWRQFQAAPSVAQQRAIVARLTTLTTSERNKILHKWIREIFYDAQAVGILARAMVDTGSETAAKRVRALLKDDRFAGAHAGILRALVDAPKQKRLAKRDFGKQSLRNPAAYLLAGRMTTDLDRLPSTRSARSLLAMTKAARLLGSPPEENGWSTLGPLIAAFPDLSDALRAELMQRVQSSLPPPGPKDLEGWPEALLLDLWRAGVPSALTMLAASPAPGRTEKLLAVVLAKRDPATVEPLVEALAHAKPNTAAFYRILAALQDLTGSKAPPDPAQWRSWVAGHQAYLNAYERLPETNNTEAAVSAGMAFLLDRQAKDGSFDYDRDGRSSVNLRVGTTALVLYALCKSGMPRDAEPLVRAASYVLHRASDEVAPYAYNHNYAAAITLMALQCYDAKHWRSQLQEIAMRISAGRKQSGGWSYGLPLNTQTVHKGVIDLSNTQYSVLGLRSAAYARIPIDPAVWEGVLRLMRGAEVKTSGDWVYGVPGKRMRPGMAAIAAASILIARSQLEKGLSLDDVLSDEQMVRALRSCARKYGHKHIYDDLDLYTLYSVERVGSLFGVYSFNGVPWYSVGARALLERQLKDGGWGFKDEKVAWYKSWGRNVDTAYALLFLRRATTPVFSAGLDVPGDPALPIRRVDPVRDDWNRPPAPPPPASERPTETPATRKSEAHRQIRNLRRAVTDSLAERLEQVDTPEDQLVVWQALAAVDPLDATAHVMAGQALAKDGRWEMNGALEAALPTAPPSRWITSRVRILLESASREAMSQAADLGAAGHELIRFSLQLKRASREVPRGR